MKKTLYLKFILAYFIFGVFGFIIVTTFVPNMTKEHLIREKAESLYSEATLIAGTYAGGLYTSETTLETVKMQLDSLAVYLNSEIRIINPSGRLVLDTNSPLDVENVVVIENFDSTVTSGSYYIVGDFFGNFDSDVLTVFAPITSNYKVKGYVVIHTDMNDIQKSCNSLLNISYITLAILFLLSLIILIFFTEIVYIPLRKITHATEQYAAGNMHYEFQVDSEDEIGYLASCLNYMASEIARSEDDQKKFVANVSHDFRSPLTSIRGYLEAMLDGTIPPEMHEKYITIVLNETERLTKLTNSLLTLNNLNTKGMLLDKTDFDINQVIRNTASTFEGTCHNKSIAIEMILTGNEMYVHADMGKIQQVLYNLMDNAIKFSHHDSVIHIETSEKKNKLFVSVKDTGIGIPKEDLKLIWDRFYKSDLSRGKDKKGTGLGLSIVKEIINAHDEHINVISTPGVGSEFIFSLPKSHQEDEEELWHFIEEAMKAALEQFVNTRILEGENLKKDLLGKLDHMEELVAFVEKRSPEIMKEYRSKLESKVKELLGDTTIDESRIATEVIIYADKICVDEETVRLRSHIEHARKCLNEDGGIGRKMDFIAQEMNREANTTLSKANDIEISNAAIDLKTEIEKVREQIQNIE